MSDAKTKVISFENIKLIDLLDSALKYEFRYERFDFCPVNYKKKDRTDLLLRRKYVKLTRCMRFLFI
jgi:hypothetical protein